MGWLGCHGPGGIVAAGHRVMHGGTRFTGQELAAGRVIVVHLGSGASLRALHGGRSVGTTMGLTALDGVRPGQALEQTSR